MSETIWRVANKVRARYRSVAQPGLRGGAPGGGPISAAQAEAYREVVGWLLAELLGRSPTCDEIARWLAGRPLPIPDRSAPVDAVMPTPPRPALPPLPTLAAGTPLADGPSAPRATNDGPGAAPANGGWSAFPDAAPDGIAAETEAVAVTFAG